MPRTTIRDVAREAKLSVASVSRALNGAANVTPKTLAHVRATADRLGYVMHAGARSLSLSRTQAVGVVLPDLHGEFFSELVRGMDRATADRGLAMLFSTMHADPGLARTAVLSMHGRVDGLIVMAPQLAAEDLARLLPPIMPAVLLASPELEGRDALRFDNRAGAAAMTRHLLAGGRRRLVHLTGPPGNLDARERREGHLAAMAEHAPELPVRLVPGDFQEESGVQAVERLLAEGIAFDALFAANDGMALGALRALKAAGLAVPDQVAVAGFDDVPLSRYVELSTVRLPLAEVGARTVAALVRRLNEPEAARREELVAPELVVRRTTEPAA